MGEGRSLTPTVILVSEKEGKSLQKRGNGKVCPVSCVGKFFLHVPYATFAGTFLLHVPC